MVLAVPRESWPGERRVAATPETVAKLVGMGFEVRIESQAGLPASFADDAYAEGRRHHRARHRRPVVVGGCPPEGAAALPRRSGPAEAGRDAHQLPVAGEEQGPHRPAGRAQGPRHRDGPDPAHHAGAEDGRAVVDGQHRRLSRRRRSRRLLRPLLHRADDGRRQGAGRQGAGHRRRRGRPGRDRRGPRPRRHRARVRHARGGEGTGQEHGRRVHRTRRARRRRGRRRLRQGNEPRLHQGRDGDVRGAGARGRHHHHDRPHPEQAGARSSSPKRW